MKRKTARAIIFIDDKLCLIKRIKNENEYYVFPGGGIKKKEKGKQAVIREVKEELGIDVRVIKKMYKYKFGETKEKYYLCEYIDGEYGSGNAKEFNNYFKGKYIVTMIDKKYIPSYLIYPKEIKEKIIKDFLGENKIG
ncbi:NUDIX domain-containing protein [Hypnocyclicus thermotrophus]|uniref:NUDIX domain-containing protein n=1 Tax=Hypnocyclicus thermotrophus TaxID=1627895 RepID=A0AA46DYI0_9FUSO|nr:NUDIX domain-containing protein [Hypnocyclicus thermotrophus]TDT70474.1 NUDIX domain-containing protein [Hypnocyclicus thermotrophus]